MRAAPALLFVVLLAAISCGGPSSGSADAPTELAGVVVGIETAGGFGEVESFTIKDGTRTYEIFVDPEITYGFPLAHLNSHRTGAEPVRVEVERRSGRLIALSIEDAG